MQHARVDYPLAVMVTGELDEVTAVAAQRVQALVGVGQIGEKLSHRSASGCPAGSSILVGATARYSGSSSLQAAPRAACRARSHGSASQGGALVTVEVRGFFSNAHRLP